MRRITGNITNMVQHLDIKFSLIMTLLLCGGICCKPPALNTLRDTGTQASTDAFQKDRVSEITPITPLDTLPIAPSISCDTESTTISPSVSAQSKELTFVNNTTQTVTIYWMDFSGKRASYGFVRPGLTSIMSTYVGHAWLVAGQDDKCMMIVPNKGTKAERVCIGPSDSSCSAPERPLDPFYTKAIADQGILFVGSSVVSDAAFDRARYLVNQMLTNSPAIRTALGAVKFRVEIIGSRQVLSDLPDYANLKGQTTSDGRSYDTGTRGIGGEFECSIGEENLLCAQQQPYPAEDIMVHEFSHSMKAHFDSNTGDASESAYNNAVQQQLYNPNIYMMNNSQEYWAEGTQAWFNKTVRTDVNDGYNTQAKLRNHDPSLAAVLSSVYGSVTLDHYNNCVY